MAQTFYAQVYEGIVNRVIAADYEFVSHWDDGLPGEWLLTDYYTRGNIHYGENGEPDGGTPIRGNYAGEGYSYDAVNDVFIPPKPYKNAILDQTTWSWIPPVESLPTITNIQPIINGGYVNFLLPTVEPEGGIVGWRYMATSALGDAINPFEIPLLIDGLEGGTTYTVNIGYMDNQGNTFWSVHPEMFVPLVAQPPAITGALPENGAVIITWATAPEQAEALHQVGEVQWRIGYKPFDSAADYTWVDSTSPAETFELTGLTNGTKYSIVVQDVVNGVGSDPSQPFYATPSAA